MKLPPIEKSAHFFKVLHKNNYSDSAMDSIGLQLMLNPIAKREEVLDQIIELLEKYLPEKQFKENLVKIVIEEE